MRQGAGKQGRVEEVREEGGFARFHLYVSMSTGIFTVQISFRKLQGFSLGYKVHGDYFLADMKHHQNSSHPPFSFYHINAL